MIRLSYGFWPLRAFFGLAAFLVAHPLISLTVGLTTAAAVIASAKTTPRHPSPPPAYKTSTNAVERWARVKATGYCPCQICCNWRHSLFGLGMPVVASGPNAGRPKAVGVTASGTRARPGVIAADTNLFAIGTTMYVPGYGWGRVEDVGGAIKGYHIDLFFEKHDEARRWGKQKREIKFWRPPGQKPTGVRIIADQ